MAGLLLRRWPKLLVSCTGGAAPLTRTFVQAALQPLTSASRPSASSSTACTPCSSPARSAHFKAKIVQPPRLAATSAQPSGFLCPDGITFSSLGVPAPLEAALQRAGFKQPSRIQESSISTLMRGSTAVIAAETGCGKTLAYLVPVVSMLLRQRLARDSRQAEEGGTEEAGHERRYHALILCPNGVLCQQVLSVINSLTHESGKGPLVSAAQVSASNPPPPQAPDIIVATPAGLLALLKEAGKHYGWMWTQEGMQACIKHVVLDEADILMGRAYSSAVQHILTMLRSGDRRRIEAKIFEELGMSEEDFDRLRRPLKLAAWRGGSVALLNEGVKPKVPLPPDHTFGPYWQRQYIFVAATMPSVTTSDVGSEISKLFPDAEWISGDLLHRSKPQVSHTWIQISNDSDKISSLVRVIKTDPDYATSRARILVFAKDGASADQLSAQLDEHGMRNVLYHSSVPPADRALALTVMQQQPCAIMVCTDAAARGLDLPGITHVVQADFAANAVDFIHRIGRTGRAGSPGKVTSLCGKENQALMEVLREFIEQGAPLESAFSRARSFSRKLKRKGQFVPRGMTMEDYQARQQQKQKV